MDDRPDDDPVIDDAVDIVRRVPWQPGRLVVQDRVTDEWRASSGAFEPDDDGVSVYRVDVLVGAGSEITDVVPATAVPAALAVGRVRSIGGLGVIDDPIEAEGLLGRAHALIRGWTSLSRNERYRRQKELAKNALLLWTQ